MDILKRIIADYEAALKHELDEAGELPLPGGKTLYYKPQTTTKILLGDALADVLPADLLGAVLGACSLSKSAFAKLAGKAATQYLTALRAAGLVEEKQEFRMASK